MTGTNCKNHWSWRSISSSLTLSTSCQSSSQIIAPVHSPSVNSPSNYLIPILLFIFWLLCALVSLLAHSSSAHLSLQCLIAKLKLFSPLWPIHCFTSHILPHLHTLSIYFFLYYVIDCMFVYSMCNSVLSFVSHCFALSWRERSCKWELVLNWPTWLNKGEKNANVSPARLLTLALLVC